MSKNEISTKIDSILALREMGCELFGEEQAELDSLKEQLDWMENPEAEMPDSMFPW